MKMINRTLALGSIAFFALTLMLLPGTSEADQGCPFNDGSCQEYCGQQGCSMGYCGHFAWIQCICRRCGDEWNWYDKVRYNPDQKVNQTELDSLKLNSTSQPIQESSDSEVKPTELPVTNIQVPITTTTSKPKQTSTIATLLIPDLSETNGKLDLNDIPDENSEKFLDYLAKNHERLAQATNSEQQLGRQQDQGEEDNEGHDDAEVSTEETVEIQISSNNSTSMDSDDNLEETRSSTQLNLGNENNQDRQNQQLGRQHQPLTRLLKIAVADIK